MNAASRPLTFRLFVSSTFSDMKQEREVLQARVFPKLRNHCAARGATFQAIDLRWGISQEAGLDQQTMSICLRELRRCQDVTPRPNFLILLGERYGWRPLSPQIAAEEFEELEKHLAPQERKRLRRWYFRDDNALPAEYVLLPRDAEFESAEIWDREERDLRALLLRSIEAAGWVPDDPRRAKYEDSATHQEIDAGALALADPEDRVLACFREIVGNSLISSAHSESDPGAQMKLRELRSKLTGYLPSRNRAVYEAEWTGDGLRADWDGFADWVETNLRRIIDREIDEAVAQATDPFDQENAAHAVFARERARHFAGQQELRSRITDHLHNTEPAQPPFVVHGTSGSGKTALIAVASLFTTHTPLITRFIGATPGSSNLRSLLTELCQQIRRATGVEFAEPILDDITKLVEHFKQLLTQMPQNQRLALFLDALDQLDDQDDPHTLYWLPRELPSNVRVVLSVLDRPCERAGRAAESAWQIFPDHAFHQITPLSREDAGPLLQSWLSDAKRALQPAQQETVLRVFDDEKNGLPLWLKLVAEEAKSWHSWEGPMELPTTIPLLLNQFLGALEEPRRHGRELVSTVLGYLGAARNGLADDELLEVVARDSDYWDHLTRTTFHAVPESRRLPPVMWARLHEDLRFALTQRQADGTILNTFYHRQVEEAVRERYLVPRLREVHSRLGEYFKSQPHHFGEISDFGVMESPNLRKLSELVRHWIAAERWDDLIGDGMQLGSLTDLLFIQAKFSAGQGFELSTDYEAAMNALPELRAEREADTAARQRCLDYARLLAEYRTRRGRGEDDSLPDPPPACQLSAGLEPEFVPPPEEPTRANRLRRFIGFTIGRRHVLAPHPDWTLLEAAHYGDSGAVFEQGALLRGETFGLWLERQPGNPSPPLHPVCRSVLESDKWVYAVASSADFTRALSGGTDSKVRIWDVESGRCLRILLGHTKSVSVVAVSADFSQAVSGSFDKTIRVWDLRSGQCLRVLEGHCDAINAMAISADFSLGVSGSFDKTIRVWDLRRGQCLRVMEGHTDVVSALAASPDFSLVLSGSWDNTLRLWDVRSGRCVRLLECHEDSVFAVALSADFSLALFSVNKNLWVWDIRRWHRLGVLSGHSMNVVAVAASADFSLALSGSMDATVRLWDVRTGKCTGVLAGHALSVQSVAASADFSTALSGSADKTLRIWDLKRGQRERAVSVHRGLVRALAASSDFSLLLSGGADKTLRLWDLETGKCQRVMEGHEELVSAVATSSDFSQAISASFDATLRLWDVQSGQCLRVLEGHQAEIDTLAASSDFSLALSASFDKTLRLWDVQSGKCLRVLEGHGDSIWKVAVSLDFSLALSSSNDSTLRMWDLKSGQCLRVMEGHNEMVGVIAASADFSLALSGSVDQALRLWDLRIGRCLQVLAGHKGPVSVVAANADFSLALSGSDDSTLRLWDLKSGQCLQVLEGHGSLVRAVVASKDFSRVVTGSQDKTVRLWDLEKGRCLAVYRASWSVMDIVANFQQGRFVCGCQDGQMHFLNLRLRTETMHPGEQREGYPILQDCMSRTRKL